MLLEMRLLQIVDPFSHTCGSGTSIHASILPGNGNVLGLVLDCEVERGAVLVVMLIK